MPQKEVITMTKQELERLDIINNLINRTEASKQLIKYKAGQKIESESN